MKAIAKGVSVLALVAMSLALAAPALANPDRPTSRSVVGTSQSNGGQMVTNNGSNNDGISAYAFASSSGNVGANVAGGNANQQSNTTYIDYGTNNLLVLTGTRQKNGFNWVFSSGENQGDVDGNAFSDSSGNIGANVASGNLNQQSNSAVILASDALSDLGASTSQTTGGSDYSCDGANSAWITDSAFSSSSGNIGANVAAGNANQQSNTLVINDGTH